MGIEFNLTVAITADDFVLIDKSMNERVAFNYLMGILRCNLAICDEKIYHYDRNVRLFKPFVTKDGHDTRCLNHSSILLSLNLLI